MYGLDESLLVVLYVLEDFDNGVKGNGLCSVTEYLSLSWTELDVKRANVVTRLRGAPCRVRREALNGTYLLIGSRVAGPGQTGMV